MSVPPFSPLRLLVGLAALAPLSGCYTRTPWKGGLPRTANELPSSDEKRSEVEAFTVVRGNLDSGGWVKTPINAPNEVYDLASFRPVIETVSPDSRERFSTLRTLVVWDAVFSGVTLVGVLMPLALRDEKTREAVFWSGIGTGIVGGLAVDAVRRNVSGDIIDGYNRDLTTRIYGNRPSPPRSTTPGAPGSASWDLGAPQATAAVSRRAWWIVAPWPLRLGVGHDL